MKASKFKAAADEPFWQKWLKAFWQGMMAPSATTLVICLAVFAATIPLTLWLFSPVGMASRAGDYIPRSGLDAEAYATVNAIRLAHDRTGAPQLVVFGSSTVAQAIGSEARLGEAIAAQTHEAWDVRLLTTPLQSPWDQLTMLETVLAGRTADAPPLVVAIGVSPLRMNWNAERLVKHETTPRLGLRSEWVDAEMRRLSAPVRPRHGSYWLDNSRFVLLNGTEALARLAVQRPATRKIDCYSASDRPLPIAKRPRGFMLREYRKNVANAPMFFALHQQLVDRISASPNVRLVFIEEALSRDIVHQGGIEQDYAARNRMIADFAARTGTEYWPIIAEAGLRDDEYYDDLHILRGAPQDKVRRAFASSFGRYVAQTGG